MVQKTRGQAEENHKTAYVWRHY